KAAHAVRESSAWSNIETQVAFADFLFHQDSLPELVKDLQDETIEHLADAAAHDLELAFEAGAGFSLRKLVLSRIDYQQLATRLLEWAGAQIPEGGAA